MNTPTRGEQSTGWNHFWNNFATSFSTYLILRNSNVQFHGKFFKNLAECFLVFKGIVIFSRKISATNFHQNHRLPYNQNNSNCIMHVLTLPNIPSMQKHWKSVRNTHNPSVHPQLFPIHRASSSNVLYKRETRVVSIPNFPH